MIRRVLLSLCLAVPAAAALAEDLPQFPKIGPPQPLPDATCDTGLANDGDWLIGRWVAPNTKWSFTRQTQAIGWSLERKGGINEGFGWRDGATITGTVDSVSGCSVVLKAGDGAFLFEGVLTEAGKLYGYAANPKGEHVRFVLRRER